MLPAADICPDSSTKRIPDSRAGVAEIIHHTMEERSHVRRNQQVTQDEDDRTEGTANIDEIQEGYMVMDMRSGVGLLEGARWTRCGLDAQDKWLVCWLVLTAAVAAGPGPYTTADDKLAGSVLLLCMALL